jgi:hypothetical protein
MRKLLNIFLTYQTNIFSISVTDNIEDVFICGKCHVNFNDLNLFLTHRLTCLIDQRSNSTNITRDIDEIMTDVTRTTASAFLIDDCSNEFDLLFSSPVGQVDQIINKNVSNFQYKKKQMKIFIF